MAYYFIFPEKDATIYSHPDRIKMNTGNDEILELVKEKGSSDPKYYPSRILIQFSNDDLKTAIKLGSNIFTSSLQLFSTEHKNLASGQRIEVFPLSQSWEEGTGKYSNLPTSSNGCSWIFRDDPISKNFWTSSNSSFGLGSTASYLEDFIDEKGGGMWYTGSDFKADQIFSNADILDLDLNVTSIVQKFSSSLLSNQVYPNGIPNHGFIIKYPDVIEEQISSSRGTLSFFSADTHTIYPPKLAIKWNDSIHNSQSLSKLNGELNVSLYNNKNEYNQNDVAKIKIHVRDKYPNRSFVTSSNYLNPGYFTTSSYYSIRDAHTEEIIIPFDDNCTKLSADSQGMYFNLYMNGLQPERYYRILFKHINNDGTQIYDNNYHFKVVR